MAELIERASVRMTPFGESAVVVEFGQSINPQTHRRVKAFADYLASDPFAGMVEYILAYTNVTVFYDPFVVRQRLETDQKVKLSLSYDIVTAVLWDMLDKIDIKAADAVRVVEIPVCYEGEFAPDLAMVAAHNRLTEEEVVMLHTSGEYLVYMIGFSPGFPFLGGMSDRIATPRRKSPRLAIPAGSVGIAGKQTGVYPLETPGGWQLIGRTPLRLFRSEKTPPSLLQAGDIVKFLRISHADYEAYEGEEKWE